MFWHPFRAVAVGCACLAATTAAGGEFGRLFHGLGTPLRAVHREPPPPACNDAFQELADRIDWLKHHLDTYGSIVAKEPDVWGQNRLMRHRVEYEEQMRLQLTQFSERTSAALRRSDQSFLGMALALQSASGRRRAPPDVLVPEVTSSNNVINSIQGLLPTTNEQAGRADAAVIARTPPLAFPQSPPGFRFDGEPLALEPTTHVDQLSRYLNHLHALRRINEGDDSADAPGYALNLVRIPVSITPGEHTRKGHGAEITITADPCLGPDLLPTTFRNLVINDLVDVIAPALTWCVNDPECIVWATTITAPAVADEPARQGVMAALEALTAKLPAAAPVPPPVVRTRRARMPIPFSQLAEVSGTRQVAILIRQTHAALAGHAAGAPCIPYTEVRSHLAEELEAAADFLIQESLRPIWDELPGWQLAALVRGRRTADLAALRCRFFSRLGGEWPAEPLPVGGPLSIIDGPHANHLVDPRCCGDEPPATPICATTTAVLAWGILLESALLDERLRDDMRQAAAAGGLCDPGAAHAPPFFGPDPAPEARQAFNDYVRRRWPIRIFALDPVREEQNVDDSYSRRRELQIAMALATASGPLNAQALARYTRRLETDLATVALNQTAVGFAHGSDTFGWRFYPRVQSPPTRGTLATLGESLRGGPTTDGDLRQRQLEPGLRECTAIIVMPSFVPAVTFDVRTHFFALVHPRHADPTMRQTLELSRSVQAMRQAHLHCSRSAHLYRPGDFARLQRSVDQLDRRLPLQTLEARIPYENTAGGFELFNTGVSDLAPELVGWYGGPGIDPAGTTTLFLIGKGFSVHDTSVIAGGRPATFRLVSRDVLQVEIPPGVQTHAGMGPTGCDPETAHARPGAVLRTAGQPTAASSVALVTAAEPLPPPTGSVAPAPAGPWPSASTTCGCGPAFDAACGLDCNRRESVELHLATPYGVSSRLFVPVARRSGIAGDCHPAFASACTIDLTFSIGRVTGSPAVQARVDEFFTADCEAIAIRVPESFIPPAKADLGLTLRDARTGETAAVLAFPNPFFDARQSRYVITAGDLRNFVGDTSRPATDKTLRGAVKPWLDTLLSRGGLAEDGAQTSLTATATIIAGQQEVPVDGGFTVRCTRRGRTSADAAEAP